MVVVVVIRIVLMMMMMMMMIEGGLCDVVGNIRGMFHGECLTILRQPMISIAGRICDYATKQSDRASNVFTWANDNNGGQNRKRVFWLGMPVRILAAMINFVRYLLRN